MDDDATRVRRLLKAAGTTYAAQAGIRLANTPMPLFQLLVLGMLAAKPIHADVATAAARELWAAGLCTPDAVLASERRVAIDAFGRAGYARYDESSTDRLVAMAKRVNDEYHGDLRRLAEACRGDVGAAARRLQEFSGIGPTGASIFLREVQDVWTWVRPFFDDRARTAACGLGLPDQPAELAALAPRSCARLAAALVRAALDDALFERLTAMTA